MSEETNAPRSNFITAIIDEHLESGRFDRVHTRFPRNPTVICTSATPSPSV